MPSNQLNLHIRKPIEHGTNKIVTRGDELEFLGFKIVHLNESESETLQFAGEEAALVILSGTATIKVGGQSYERIGGRQNVFQANATTVYVPCDHEAIVTAVGPGPLSVAVCAATSSLKRQPTLIRPEDVRTKSVGRANWRRTVKDIIDFTFDAGHIVVGETINLPGNWSSSPPHKHEVDNPPHEVKMEEIYFYQFNPEQGFGVQRLYTDDRELDVCYAIEHNDTVLIPKGYHPVGAAPGYQLYYLWFMAGPTSRVLRPKDDPAHAWLKSVEPVIDTLG